jgi:hypothetical protein
MITRCVRNRSKRHRTTLSITIDPHVLEALRKWMKREGETNLSAAIEGFIDCGVRDSCEGCPYYDDTTPEEGEKREGKIGVSKRKGN